ncbi:MAG: hypothetical protein NTV80_23050 [Verrucomicrobia bacterium]|nr:hypothetical protein [Verrucomicrobiota bacterium]
MSRPGEETHVYTDNKTDFSVYKVWDLLGPLTSPYYKLYDADKDYVRKYDSKSDAVEAARNGDS